MIQYQGKHFTYIFYYEYICVYFVKCLNFVLENWTNEIYSYILNASRSLQEHCLIAALLGFNAKKHTVI